MANYTKLGIKMLKPKMRALMSTMHIPCLTLDNYDSTKPRVSNFRRKERFLEPLRNGDHQEPLRRVRLSPCLKDMSKADSRIKGLAILPPFMGGVRGHIFNIMLQDKSLPLIFRNAQKEKGLVVGQIRQR